jgi:hypothetical protein
MVRVLEETHHGARIYRVSATADYTRDTGPRVIDSGERNTTGHCHSSCEV